MFDRSKHGVEPSTDSQKALGCFNRSRHGLEPITDSKTVLGCFNRSRHVLEPSIDCQKAVGRFDRSKHGLEPSIDLRDDVRSGVLSSASLDNRLSGVWRTLGDCSIFLDTLLTGEDMAHGTRLSLSSPEGPV